MTKKNIANVKFLKKIVKKKEREDADNARPTFPPAGIDFEDIFIALCRRHNE